MAMYQPAPASYHLSGLPPGKRGTEKTLRAMADFVRASTFQPTIVDHARQIASKGSPHDVRSQVTAIFNHVLHCLFYINDPVNVEWIQDAAHTTGFGDCDDAAVLISSYCACIGVVCEFVVCGFDPSDSSYEHVWTQAYIEPTQFDKGGWLDLDVCADPRTGNNFPGYFAKNATNLGIYPIFPELMTGLGQDEGGDYTGDYTDYFFDPSGDGGGGYDPNADPNALSTSDSELFDWLQSEFGAGSGDIVDPFNAADSNDTGVMVSPDGTQYVFAPDGSFSAYDPSTDTNMTFDANGNEIGMTVYNPNGTYTSINPQTGAAATYDNNGTLISNASIPTSQIKQAAQKAVSQVASGSGGGSGFSMGGGGGQKASQPQQQQQTGQSVTTQIGNLFSQIANALGIKPGNPYASSTTYNPALYPGGINPQTGLAVNASTSGLGVGVSTTTLLLILLGAYVVFKK